MQAVFRASKQLSRLAVRSAVQQQQRAMSGKVSVQEEIKEMNKWRYVTANCTQNYIDV